MATEKNIVQRIDDELMKHVPKGQYPFVYIFLGKNEIMQYDECRESDTKKSIRMFQYQHDEEPTTGPSGLAIVEPVDCESYMRLFLELRTAYPIEENTDRITQDKFTPEASC